MIVLTEFYILATKLDSRLYGKYFSTLRLWGLIPAGPKDFSIQLIITYMHRNSGSQLYESYRYLIYSNCGFLDKLLNLLQMISN